MTETTTMSQTWQPIETAPRDGTRVLLASPDGKVQEGYFVDRVEFRYGKETSRSQNVVADRWSIVSRDLLPTHWMPLPAAPTTDAEAPA